MIEKTKARIKVAGGRTLEFVISLDLEFHTQRAIHNCLRAGHMYEKHSSIALLGALREGDAFIDVGAHVGYYTLLARAAVGPEGRVFAFEPNPETYRQLVANIVGNGFGNVYAFNCAVGDKNGVMTLHINDDNEGESALWDVGKTGRFPKSGAAARQVGVAVTTLDDLGRGGTMKGLRAMKIDAEGWEHKVLAGAKLLLNSYKPAHVVCEINRGALSATGGKEMSIRKFFAQLGYGCYLLNLTNHDIFKGKTMRALGPDEKVDTRYVFNLLFSRAEKAEPKGKPA